MLMRALHSNSYLCIYLKIGPITPERQSDVQQVAPSSSSVEESLSNWTESDVQTWLKKSKLDDLCDCLEGFEGDHILEMYNDFRQDPRKFEDDMKSDFQMNHKNYLKFKVALGKLFKK